MDELKQELLSKATGIGPTPKKVLIQEGVEKWLPLVMGIAGPPTKVPPLPTGRTGYNQLRKILDKMVSGPYPVDEAGELTESSLNYLSRMEKNPEIMDLLRRPMEKLSPNAQTEMLDNDKIHRLLQFLAD